MRLRAARAGEGPDQRPREGDESAVVPAGEPRLQVAGAERASRLRDVGRRGRPAGAPLAHQRPCSVHRQRGHAAHTAQALRGRLPHPRRRRAGTHLPRTPRRHEALPQDRRLHLLRLRRHHVVRQSLQGSHLSGRCNAQLCIGIRCSSVGNALCVHVILKPPNADNTCFVVDLSTAEIKRYKNTISGTSGHCSSTPVVPIDSHGMTSFLSVFYTLGGSAV